MFHSLEIEQWALMKGPCCRKTWMIVLQAIPEFFHLCTSTTLMAPASPIIFPMLRSVHTYLQSSGFVMLRKICQHFQIPCIDASDGMTPSPHIMWGTWPWFWRMQPTHDENIKERYVATLISSLENVKLIFNPNTVQLMFAYATLLCTKSTLEDGKHRDPAVETHMLQLLRTALLCLVHLLIQYISTG